LRRKLTDRKARPAYTEKIVDDRRVSTPNAYNIFYVERWSGGDMKGIKVTDAAKLIGNEWKTLTAAEKKVCMHITVPESLLIVAQKYYDEEKARRAKATA
jgi:hypothetical protein